MCYNLRSIPLLQEDKLQPVKRQLLPERFLQEHDEQRKGGIGGGGGGSAYPGVEEPILDFLASPAIREEGQAGRNFPHLPFSLFLPPHLFPPENIVAEVQAIPDPLIHGALTKLD